MLKLQLKREVRDVHQRSRSRSSMSPRGGSIDPVPPPHDLRDFPVENSIQKENWDPDIVSFSSLVTPAPKQVLAATTRTMVVKQQQIVETQQQVCPVIRQMR